MKSTVWFYRNRAAPHGLKSRCVQCTSGAETLPPAMRKAKQGAARRLKQAASMARANAHRRIDEDGTRWKRCADCKQWLPVSGYHKSGPARRLAFGVDAICKRCSRIKRTTRRAVTGATAALITGVLGSACLRCGREAGVQWDHIIPRAHGGRDTAVNLQPLCIACNGSKGARHATDYRTPQQRKQLATALQCDLW